MHHVTMAGILRNCPKIMRSFFINISELCRLNVTIILLSFTPKSGVVYCVYKIGVVSGINLVYGRFGKNTLNVGPPNIDVGLR